MYSSSQPRLLHWYLYRKLGKDCKADWPKHLLELVHAYKSTRLAVTAIYRYSPYNLMFGQ